MAWTSPKTFTANSTFTAADLNTFLRDNMAETTAAKAVTPGAMFVTNGNNSIEERFAQADYIATQESTTLTTATGVNLATAGPTVSVITGARALVFLYAQLWWTGTRGQVFMGYAVSSSTVVPFSNNKSIVMSHTASGRGQRVGICLIENALTPGLNVFQAKYKSSTSTTANFSDRRLAVLPF